MFKYAYFQDALASVQSSTVKAEIREHIEIILKLVSKAHQDGLETTPPSELIDQLGNQYLSTLPPSEAVAALLTIADRLEARQAALNKGDLSFTHDDSAASTFSALGSFCFLSNWHLSSAFRYLNVASALYDLKLQRLNVIDIGCSEGTFLRFWHQNATRPNQPVLDYTGIEVREEAVQKARDAFPGVKFELANVLETPLQTVHPEPADAVLLLEIIEHVGKDAALQLLKDAYDTLKPGGIVCVSSPNPKKHLGQEFVWIENHAYEFSLLEIVAELEKVGFSMVSTTGWLADDFVVDDLPTLDLVLYDGLETLGKGMASALTAYLNPRLAKHYTIIART